MQEVDFNHPDSKYAMNKLIDEASAKTIVLDDDSVLYIELNPHRSYPPRTLDKLAETVRTTFQAVLPNTKVVVGFQGLEFNVITHKQAFNGILKGTVK